MRKKVRAAFRRNDRRGNSEAEPAGELNSAYSLGSWKPLKTMRHHSTFKVRDIFQKFTIFWRIWSYLMAVSRLLLDGNKAAADVGPDGWGCGLAKFPGSSILSNGIRPLDSTNPGVEWLLPKAARIEGLLIKGWNNDPFFFLSPALILYLSCPLAH